MRISDWSSDVCSSDLCARSPTYRESDGPRILSMTFDPNQRAIRPNEPLEALVKQQTAVLEKILEKLEEISGIMVDTTGTMIERSEEHTSELQSLMRISYAVFCLQKTKNTTQSQPITPT